MIPPLPRCPATLRRASTARALLGVALVAGLTLGGLTGCSHTFGSTADREGATPKAMAACRQRADEVFDRQNRGEVYRSDMLAGGERDSPFASTGTSGNPGAGLPARYARETMVDDCLNAASGSPGASPDAPVPAGLSPEPTATPRQ